MICRSVARTGVMCQSKFEWSIACMSNDAVFRVAAGEIRRRLAKYSLYEGLPGEIVFDLPPGSYVPLFSTPGQSGPTSEVRGSSAAGLIGLPDPKASDALPQLGQTAIHQERRA